MKNIKRLLSGVLATVLTLSIATTGTAVAAEPPYGNTPDLDFIYRVDSKDHDIAMTATHDTTDRRIAVITVPSTGGIITLSAAMPTGLVVKGIGYGINANELIAAGGSFIETGKLKYTMNDLYPWNFSLPGDGMGDINQPMVFPVSSDPITMDAEQPFAFIDLKIPPNLTKEIKIYGTQKNQLARPGDRVPIFDDKNSDYGKGDRVVLIIKPETTKPVYGNTKEYDFIYSVSSTDVAINKTATHDTLDDRMAVITVPSTGGKITLSSTMPTGLSILAMGYGINAKELFVAGGSFVKTAKQKYTMNPVYVWDFVAPSPAYGDEHHPMTFPVASTPILMIKDVPFASIDLIVPPNLKKAIKIYGSELNQLARFGDVLPTFGETDSDYVGGKRVVLTIMPENATATVTTVTVDPATANVNKGAMQMFTATVAGTNSPAQTVKWAVDGNSSGDTKIDADGKLVVAANETATALTVTATSTIDTGKSGTAAVTVQTPAATITAVTVTPATAEVSKGMQKQFTAKVEGTSNPAQAVTWGVTGNKSATTKISNMGVLIIGSDETATVLTVTAASIVEDTKKGTAIVTVSADPAATVTSVTVDPVTATVDKGTEKEFKATVVGTHSPTQAVIWTVTGGTSDNTIINGGGMLTIGGDETATSLTVKATSDLDPTKSGTASVTISTASTATVTSVTVTPETATMSKATEKQFTAAVLGIGIPAKAVTWSVTGAKSATTKISMTGMLTIGADETSTALTVTAKSDIDSSKLGTAKITVEIPPAATVTSVTVTPDTASMDKGTTRQFKAMVVGVGSPVNTVTWTVRGNNSNTTGINATGLLTVGSAETSTTLTVTAMSTADKTKFGTAAVTVKSGGGGGGGGSVSNYVLTFKTNDGSAITAVKKSSGSTIELSGYTTKRAGYTFEGWYSDAALTTKIATVQLKKDMTVYAKWSQDKVPHLCSAFTDINGHWAENAICAVVEAKYFNGINATTFSPNMNLSRGMFVTILYRYTGSPAVTGKIPFGDVAANAFYAEAVIWATKNGIVNGYSDDAFAPDDDITREQMAALMERYAKMQKLNSKASGGLNAFSDHAQISSWANDSMGWAVANGLLQGEQSKLSPMANATRAEAATILQRMEAKWG